MFSERVASSTLLVVASDAVASISLPSINFISDTSLGGAPGIVILRLISNSASLSSLGLASLFPLSLFASVASSASVFLSADMFSSSSLSTKESKVLSEDMLRRTSLIIDCDNRELVLVLLAA